MVSYSDEAEDTYKSTGGVEIIALAWYPWTENDDM